MYFKNIIVNFFHTKVSIEFIKFGIVGTTALIFESSLILIFFKVGLDPKYSRIITIPLAILLTWYLNRTFTFKNKNKQKIKQYGKYFMVIMFGISINYSVYIYFLELFQTVRYGFILALCLGSISSMFFNFAFSKFIIFKN